MLHEKGKTILKFQSLQKFKHLYKYYLTVMLVQQQDNTTAAVHAPVMQLMLRVTHKAHKEFFTLLFI